MVDPDYDSPTFLSQKDKYFMGLSLVQMLGVVVIAFVAFFLSLTFPMGMVGRLIMVILGTVVTGVLVFGRIAGLSIPGYVLLMLLSLVRRSVYEEGAEVLLAGSDEFLAGLEEREARGAARAEGWLSRGRDLAVGEERAAWRNEVKTEVNKGVVQGAQSVEEMVRDGIRNIKGS